MNNRIAEVITQYKKSIVFTFFTLAVCSMVLALLVPVNYNMVDYLPQNAQSTTAIRIMEEEFGGQIPNARVMISNVTIQEALGYKERIAATVGVAAISWLDDIVGRDTLTTTPVQFLDASILENYYQDNSALFTITIESGMEKSTVGAIRDLVGEENAVAGEAVNMAESQKMSSSEVIKAIAILVPLILLILILSTASWIEPILFIVVIGVAVLLNMGTNIFLGEVSFVTQSISPVLQLAVSLDYAIFLLHGFNEYRNLHNPQQAMKLALKKAFSAVAASAATTVIGFLALTFMRFEIGPDLGINLVKGVILSFISVMVFLPALTLMTYLLIDKTKHRRVITEFRGAGRWVMKISRPILILAVIIVIPCFLAQSSVEFMYGTGGITGASRAGQDAVSIEQRFGKENTLVLLVPKENAGKEAEVSKALSDIPRVSGVASYVTTVGGEIPPEYVPEEVVDQFYSENYARIILYTHMPEEGTQTFETVQNVLDTAHRHYDRYYLAGQGVTLYDMSNIVSSDTQRINLVAILGIFLVLLLTFRSPVIPLLLLFTIETAIWMNLSFVYFRGQSINFIGYLVISTVQLGATVDYAILTTDRYLANRKTLSKVEAMETTIDSHLDAILIPAVILATAGFILAFTSTNPIVAELGILLGRGTLLSLIMVVGVLPALLVIFDKVIQKTKLYKGEGLE